MWLYSKNEVELLDKLLDQGDFPDGGGAFLVFNKEEIDEEEIDEEEIDEEEIDKKIINSELFFELLSSWKWKKIANRKLGLKVAVKEWLITDEQINIARWLHFSEQVILDNPKVVTDIIRYYVSNVINQFTLREIVNKSIWYSNEKWNIKRTPEEVLEEIQNEKYNSD